MLKNTEKAPSPRIAKKREQVEHEILEIAQSILSETGPKGITLASVAGRLGMTKQSLYHYYSSKEALIRALVANLLDQEIEALLAAVAKQKSDEKVLGALIKAFHAHYVDKLGAFRTIYCGTQMYAPSNSDLDEITLREEIHPRTRQLFDVLERRIAEEGASRAERKRARQLAFTAWTSALGLMAMLGVADATDDPIMHPEKALLRTLSLVFDNAVSEGM
jgi:AcrR family transcriptional regulator